MWTRIYIFQYSITLKTVKCRCLCIRFKTISTSVNYCRAHVRMHASKPANKQSHIRTYIKKTARSLYGSEKEKEKENRRLMMSPLYCHITAIEGGVPNGQNCEWVRNLTLKHYYYYYWHSNDTKLKRTWIRHIDITLYINGAIVLTWLLSRVQSSKIQLQNFGHFNV